MRPPRLDAFQMRRVEIARPPDDVGEVPGEIDHMLAGAAAGLDHVAGCAGEIALQHRADRLMIAMKRRRIEAPVRLDRPAIPAELHHIFSHVTCARYLPAPDQGLPALNCDCSSSRKIR